MTKIYAIAAGEYSDWRIEAVYLDEELAKQALEKIQLINPRDSWELVDYEISTELPLTVETVSYQATVLPGGKLEQRSYETSPHHEYRSTEIVWPPSEITTKPADVHVMRVAFEGSRATVYAKGTNLERTKRVFYDRLAQVQAENAGF
jgi:hypothetical protein